MGRTAMLKGTGARRTIQISAAAFEKLKAYSDLTGVNLGNAATRGLLDWLETTGAVHMETLTGRGLALPAARNPQDLPALPPPADLPQEIERHN